MRLSLPILFVLFALSLGAGDPPPVPAGFTWYAVPDSRAFLLKPEGWSVTFEEHDQYVAYRIEPSSDLDATFSFTIVRGTGPSDPEDFVAKWLTGLESQLRLLGDRPQPSRYGPFHVGGGFYLEPGGSPNPNRAFMQMLVNPDTGTYYVIGFEAPAEDWQTAWEIGQVCAGQFVIDDED